MRNCSEICRDRSSSKGSSENKWTTSRILFWKIIPTKYIQRHQSFQALTFLRNLREISSLFLISSFKKMAAEKGNCKNTQVLGKELDN